MNQRIEANDQRGLKLACFCAVAASALFVLVLRLAAATHGPKSDMAAVASGHGSVSASDGKRGFEGLMSSSVGESAAKDIAFRNLVCAEGLPGAENLELQAGLETLDSWALHIKAETERHLYRFREHPEEYEHSEGYFRVLMMAVVLNEDYHVRYDPAMTSPSMQRVANDFFFADSRDVFLHGLLGANRKGTCSSMPVLYVAIGRRLGYPLKLVAAKGHLFARGETAEGRERFNIETTSQGLLTLSDQYYETWPCPMTEADLSSGRYLRSLSTVEETALFLQTRGLCLKATGRLAEAKTAWEAARRLAPSWSEHDLLIATLNINIH